MSAVPRRYADVEGLITLLQVACDDHATNTTLESLLSLPDARRREVLDALLASLRARHAQRELLDALACLIDDGVAEQVAAAIHACKR